MPAKSKAQQRFFGMVHAVQKGDMKAPSKEVADAAKSISKGDAKDFAETKQKGLPEKKEEKKSMVDISKLTGPDLSYLEGFVGKCAEHKVDPEALLAKLAGVGEKLVSGAKKVLDKSDKVLSGKRGVRPTVHVAGGAAVGAGAATGINALRDKKAEGEDTPKEDKKPGGVKGMVKNVAGGAGKGGLAGAAIGAGLGGVAGGAAAGKMVHAVATRSPKKLNIGEVAKFIAKSVGRGAVGGAAMGGATGAVTGGAIRATA